MTVEDALIGLLTVVAAVMLFGGLAQVLDDRPSRRVRRIDGQPRRSPMDEPEVLSSPALAIDAPAVRGGGEAAEPFPSGVAESTTSSLARADAVPEALSSPALPAARPAVDRAAPSPLGDPSATGEAALEVVRRLPAMAQTHEAEPAPGPAPSSAGAPSPSRVAGDPDGPRPDVLDPAWTEVVVGFAGEHRFAEARRWIRRGVDDGEISPAHADHLHGLVVSALRQEIHRLTVGAVRGGADDDAAARDVDLAHHLLASLPDEALPAADRGAMVRRIWRGRASVGFRRLRQGQLETAADALLNALRTKGIGRRAQRQVRDALVRTLEGMVDGESQGVATDASPAEREAAATRLARIERRVDQAREEGIEAEELEATVGRLRQLAGRLEQTQSI